ncbi:MAG: heparinase II/III family protein [Rubrivivax sp.]
MRIVNWIKWFLAGEPAQAPWLASLAVQARWLAQRLEWHLLGNHLFANAKALFFAGLFFEGREADEWLATGARILERELPEQVLDDGGQFERSPMYHALALEDVLDLLNVLRDAGVGCASGLASAAPSGGARTPRRADAALAALPAAPRRRAGALQRHGRRDRAAVR